MRRILIGAALPALGAFASTARAHPDDDLRKGFEDFKRHAAETEANYQRRISDLEKKLAEKPPDKPSDLQEQIDDLVDKVDAIDARVGTARGQQAPTIKYLDISLNSLMTAGTSTANDQTLGELEGGHHDPHRRGFTIQNTELGLSGAVDPYFKGFANMVQTIDANGDTVVELEEAYAQTTSLPYGLQAKAGQYFTAFGRLNPQHPHQWEFVDQPIVNTRMFGDDGMRGPGVQASWLAPASFPLELVAGVQNANGNTMWSFAGPADSGPPAGKQVDRTVKTLGDMVWSARADASIDLTDEIPAMIGVSEALGPSGASATGNSSILGADLTLKWKPVANDHGFPYVAFQGEWIRRHYDYDSFVDGGSYHAGGEQHDSGEYAQLVYGFMRDWTAGVRFDRVQGTDNDVLGEEDRNRWSVALTWYTSEFAKLRLQVNVDDSTALHSKQTSVWLQFEFNLGTHGAHRF
jgi:hypothetical protein